MRASVPDDNGSTSATEHALEPYAPQAGVVSRFTYGARMPLRALMDLARTPELWTYVGLPIALTIVLLALAGMGSLWLTATLTPVLIPTPAGGSNVVLAFVQNLVWASLLVGSFALFAVAAWFTGLQLASPFYDALSERIERDLGAVAAGVVRSPAQIASDISRGVLHSVGNFGLYLALSCPLACAGLVPLVGEALAMVGGTFLSSLFVAMEVFDFSLARRRWSWWEKVRWVWTHRAVALGLGFGSWLLLLIPLGGFFAMPAAVIAATRLFVALDREGLVPDREA